MGDGGWPLPSSGVTLWHVTDSHFSNKPGLTFTEDHGDAATADLTQSKVLPLIAGKLHTGDIIDGSNPTYPDTWAKNWLTATGFGANDIYIPGNHDYIGSAGTSGPSRNRSGWEAVYGRSVNQSGYYGPAGSQIRVLGFSADVKEWAPAYQDGLDSWNLTAATLSWVDTQLSADPSTPTWLACHYMLQEQGSYGSGTKVQPESNILALISGHANVIGWLSGHAHYGITDNRLYEPLAVAGRAAMPAISGPSVGYYPGAADFSGAARSLFVTYVDAGRIEIRYRDHGNRMWVAGRSNEKTTVVTPG